MANIFNMRALTETEYVAIVEAESAWEACEKFGTMIRAGELEPKRGPSIAHMEAHRQRDHPEE